MDSLTLMLNNLGDFADAITINVPRVIAAGAVISAVWKRPDTQGFLSTVHSWVNKIGCNFGHAANK